MLTKTVTSFLFVVALSTAAYATSIRGPENPCLDGYQWYPDKKQCVRKIADSTPTKATCKPGTTRQVKRGRRMVTQTCGFVK